MRGTHASYEIGCFEAGIKTDVASDDVRFVEWFESKVLCWLEAGEESKFEVSRKSAVCAGIKWMSNREQFRCYLWLSALNLVMARTTLHVRMILYL